MWKLVGKNKTSRGYTIVEVMIFMAVSGVMFLMAVVFISGKQASVDFRHSMSDVNLQIKTIVNEVANGEYQSLGSNKCVAGAASQPVVSSGVASQGSNGGASGCIFLGKVVQFNTGGDKTQYTIYTIAGRQLNASSSPVSNFVDAKPMALDSSAPARSTANLTQTRTLLSGLEFIKALSCTSNCGAAIPVYSAVGDFGFFGSFGGFSAASGSNSSSATQTVVTAIIPNSTSGQSRLDTVNLLNDSTTWSPIDTSASTYVVGGGRTLVLCFKYGKKYGSVTVGGTNGQQFTTDLQTGNGVPSACIS